jgi:hypothetical protein
MASWNLDERMLISTVPPTLENSSRLLFYHFSKAPSEGFQNSVKTGLYHYNVLKIAKTYGDMLKNETIVESLAQVFAQKEKDQKSGDEQYIIQQQIKLTI